MKLSWESYKTQYNELMNICRVLLLSEQTIKNGIKNYPSHPARIQLGIWDGSSPQGTAQWAKGPVNWAHAPATSKAVIRSITVECPYS